MNFEYRVDYEEVMAAFRRAPGVMEQALGRGLDSAAMKMVQEGRSALRENDSLSFSTLLNSITYENAGKFERNVFPDTAYAQYLEEGTKPGYYPPAYALAGWLRTRGAADPERAAYRLQRHIHEKGTAAKPFWAPAFAKAEPQMRKIVADYAARGVSRAFGGAI